MTGKSTPELTVEAGCANELRTCLALAAVRTSRAMTAALMSETGLDLMVMDDLDAAIGLLGCARDSMRRMAEHRRVSR
jgi:hypothetical protein